MSIILAAKTGEARTGVWVVFGRELKISTFIGRTNE
jgi:hypothetical protein